MYVDSSTRHPMDHLKNKHRIVESGKLPLLGQRSSVIPQAFGNSSPRIQFNITVFRQLLLQWILLCNISFRQVEHPTFRVLLGYLAAITSTFTAIPQQFPRLHNTIKAWVLNHFSYTWNILQSNLEKVITCII